MGTTYRPTAAGRKPWYCSMSGIDWLAHGHQSRALQSLIRDLNIKIDGCHRAGHDAEAVVKLLACCARDGKTFLCKLVS